MYPYVIDIVIQGVVGANVINICDTRGRKAILSISVIQRVVRPHEATQVDAKREKTKPD